MISVHTRYFTMVTCGLDMIKTTTIINTAIYNNCIILCGLHDSKAELCSPPRCNSTIQHVAITYGFVRAPCQHTQLMMQPGRGMAGIWP